MVASDSRITRVARHPSAAASPARGRTGGTDRRVAVPAHPLTGAGWRAAQADRRAGRGARPPPRLPPPPPLNRQPRRGGSRAAACRQARGGTILLQSPLLSSHSCTTTSSSAICGQEHTSTHGARPMPWPLVADTVFCGSAAHDGRCCLALDSPRAHRNKQAGMSLRLFC